MTFHEVFLEDDVLCASCRKTLKRVGRWIQVDKMLVYAYYEYDDAMSTIFHRYKEAHDQALGRIFLHPIRKFDQLYKQKTIVCAPSSEIKNDERGFMTLEKILEESNVQRIDVLRKESTQKQSLRSVSQRTQVKGEITLHNQLLAEEKDLILFDDIVTTGSTMKACYALLNPVARSLKCVCIAIHPIFLENSRKSKQYFRKLRI